MNRKQRRTINKIAKNKEAASSIDLMLNMPDECLTCSKHYDKLSKEIAKEWFVEVYKAQKKVNLYCRECYEQRRKNEGQLKNSTNV
jgi:hypothetical protein